jgi:hypothetical protein
MQMLEMSLCEQEMLLLRINCISRLAVFVAFPTKNRPWEAHLVSALCNQMPVHREGNGASPVWMSF